MSDESPTRKSVAPSRGGPSSFLVQHSSFRGGVRARAILLGLLLFPLNTYWVIAMGVFRGSGNPTATSLFFNAVLALMAVQALNRPGAPVGVLASCWALLHWSYLEGCAGREPSRFGSQAWYRLDNGLHQPWAPDWGGLAAIGAGAFIAWALMCGRLNRVWFPFHSMGYAISANRAMNCVWMPPMIAWLAKVAIMRCGGGRGYRAAAPFALGLILGEFTIGSLWPIPGLLLGIPTYSFWLF